MWEGTIVVIWAGHNVAGGGEGRVCEKEIGKVKNEEGRKGNERGGSVKGRKCKD